MNQEIVSLKQMIRLKKNFPSFIFVRKDSSLFCASDFFIALTLLAEKTKNGKKLFCSFFICVCVCVVKELNISISKPNLAMKSFCALFHSCYLFFSLCMCECEILDAAIFCFHMNLLLDKLFLVIHSCVIK